MSLRRQLLAIIVIALIVPGVWTGCGSSGDTTADASEVGNTTTDGDAETGETGPQGEAGPQGEEGPEGPAGEDGARTAIPADVWLDGVNRIDFFSATDGLIMQAEDTTAAGTLPGAFNGGGTGNKAFVGLNAYDGTPVGSITDLSVTARLDRGVSFFYLNLQVDCDGDGDFDADDGIVVVDSVILADFALATGAMTTIDIDPTAAIFKMVGGPKASCGNLPGHLGAVGSPLTDMPASAELWNGSTGDGGMPRDTEMASILFVMGDSGSQDARTMTLDSITFNGDEYLFR